MKLSYFLNIHKLKFWKKRDVEINGIRKTKINQNSKNKDFIRYAECITTQTWKSKTVLKKQDKTMTLERQVNLA